MIDVDFVLSRDQRDEIMRAVKAIERQVGQMVGEAGYQALWVIGTGHHSNECDQLAANHFQTDPLPGNR